METIHSNYARGLYKRNLVHKDSLAILFINEWNEYLLKNINSQDKSLKEINNRESALQGIIII